MALLCGDDDDTVRTARTVDGCSRCVFQHVERLDILWVDGREEVGACVAHLVVVHRHAVDNDQRIVAGVQ